MSIFDKFVTSLTRYKDNLGATIMSFSRPIKIIMIVYITMAILPFIAAYAFLMIDAIYHNHADIDRFIKLGSTIIGEPAVSFVTFILGLCINGEKMINKRISEDSRIMKSYIKRNNIVIQAKAYTDEDNAGKK